MKGQVLPLSTILYQLKYDEGLHELGLGVWRSFHDNKQYF